MQSTSLTELHVRFLHRIAITIQVKGPHRPFPLLKTTSGQLSPPVPSRHLGAGSHLYIVFRDTLAIGQVRDHFETWGAVQDVHFPAVSGSRH